MIFKEQRLAFAKILNKQYPQEEINSFFYLLTDHYFGWSKFETHQKDFEEIPSEQQQHFSEALKRLKTHEPIQYIMGETEFYGLPFKVNKHTLIPRPETEELVYWVFDDNHIKLKEIGRNDDAYKTPIYADVDVLDIGTGSGCIAITLAGKYHFANVTGLDVSKEAIEIARENSLNLGANVEFLVADILSQKKLPKKYDVIISNPPYVRESEKELMRSNVLCHEPENALFVSDKDPLIFYRKIARLAFVYLKEGGALYFEINEFLKEEMILMLNEIGFYKISMKQDIYGKDRMIRCLRKNDNFKAMYTGGGGKEGFKTKDQAWDYIDTQVCEKCRGINLNSPDKIAPCYFEWGVYLQEINFDGEIEWERIN